MKIFRTCSTVLLCVAVGTVCADPGTELYRNWHSIFDPVVTTPVEPVEGEPVDEPVGKPVGEREPVGKPEHEPGFGTVPVVRDEPSRRYHRYPDRDLCASPTECGPGRLAVEISGPAFKLDFGTRYKAPDVRPPYPPVRDGQGEEPELRIGPGAQPIGTVGKPIGRIGVRLKSRVPKLRYIDDEYEVR